MNKQLQLASIILVLLAIGAAMPSARGETVESFTEPYRTIELASPEPGTLTELPVREGDLVKKGQLLATLDLEVLLASLEIARARMEATARLDSATAELAMRQTRLEKLELLIESGNARPQEVERARADVEIAEASVRLAEEDRLVNSLEYKKIQAQIAHRKIASPVDGVVTELFKHEAELVTAMDPRVLMLVQLDPLCVNFSVTTRQAADMAAGHKIKLTFPDPPAKAEGQIEVISPVTDKASGTVKVKVIIPNPKGTYRSGVRCTTQVKTDLKKHVPSTADGNAEISGTGSGAAGTGGNGIEPGIADIGPLKFQPGK